MVQTPRVLSGEKTFYFHRNPLFTPPYRFIWLYFTETFYKSIHRCEHGRCAVLEQLLHGAAARAGEWVCVSVHGELDAGYKRSQHQRGGESTVHPARSAAAQHSPHYVQTQVAHKSSNAECWSRLFSFWKGNKFLICYCLNIKIFRGLIFALPLN